MASGLYAAHGEVGSRSEKSNSAWGQHQELSVAQLCQATHPFSSTFLNSPPSSLASEWWSNVFSKKSTGNLSSQEGVRREADICRPWQLKKKLT